MPTYKILNSFALKFSGNSNEDAELFLEELIDCVKNSSIDKKKALKAVPRILQGTAKIWYQSEKKSLTSWKRFKKKFRSRFVTPVDDADLKDDLKARTQAPNEKIAEFINDFKTIIRHFKKRPSKQELVNQAHRQLHPEYRKYMSGKKIKTFEDILHYGQKFERELHLDKSYEPPKTKEFMHVKSAAYKIKEKDKKKKKKAAEHSKEKKLLCLVSERNQRIDKTKKKTLNKVNKVKPS